jgi:hypothetical protein
MFEKMLFFIVVLVISVAFLFSAISTTVLAYGNTNDTVIIDVNVSSISQITLLPSTLTWVTVGAGTAGGHKNITVKNTGSLNLTQIYAYVDTLVKESTRPYGTGDPGKYSAGGVLTIRNETDNTYFYLGRIEWNWTQDIPNHNWGNVTSPIAWGYFRNLTDDYVWVLGNGTAGYCNNTTTQFAIEDNADVGTVATRTPDKATIALNGNDTNWTYFSVNRATSSLYQYCVAAYYDCSKIYIYKFDKRDGNLNESFAGCTGNADYLYSGSGAEGPLMPGSTIILKVDPWVPYGTPAGNLNTTTLTVVAT